MSIDLRPATPPAPLPLGAIAAACGLTTLGPGGSAEPPLSGLPEVTVTGVTHDSRAVRPGDLFAALPGAHAHGAAYAEQAASLGAAAVLTDAAGAQMVGDLPVLLADDPREALGCVAAEIYRHPARDMLLLGVTGTNGKSTTVHLLEAGLRAAGHTTGIIGTTGVRIGDRNVPNDRTTPEAPDLHALLALMREEGVTAVAMEVSSHALVLGRVNGVVYDIAIFTQLSQDHLDFHGTMEDYFAAKADLFTAARARRAVIGVDGMWGRRLADQCEIPAITYALDHDADVVCASVVTGPAGQTLTLRDDSDLVEAGGPLEIEVGLPGRFNAANALGSWAALRAAGIHELPRAGHFTGHDVRALWSRPTECLALTRDATVACALLESLQPGALARGYAVDRTAGVIAIEFRGPGMDRLLARLVDASAIPRAPGQATRARLVDVGAHLLRIDDEHLWLLCDRAHADYLGAWLLDAIERIEDR